MGFVCIRLEEKAVPDPRPSPSSTCLVSQLRRSQPHPGDLLPWNVGVPVEDRAARELPVGVGLGQCVPPGGRAMDDGRRRLPACVRYAATLGRRRRW